MTSPTYSPTFIAGEDIHAGALVTIDPETGHLRERTTQPRHPSQENPMPQTPVLTVEQRAERIADEAYQRHVDNGNDTADLDRDFIAAAAREELEQAIAIHLDRAEIRKAISDAFYDARNKGGTMETAADAATDAVLQVIGR